MHLTIEEVLGERLQTIRRRRGMTQQDLAYKAKMAISTLCRIEKGQQTMHVDKLVALAKLLGVSVDYLVGFSDKPEMAGKRENDAEFTPTTLAHADELVTV
jgi:transcriptional regulator with XRE-family HTH domain